MENFTTISSRIKQLIDFKGVSINKFSSEIGTSNSYFNKMIKTNGEIGSNKIEKILRKNPNINPEWLLTGKGEMLRQTLPDGTEPTPPEGVVVRDPCTERLAKTEAQYERIIAQYVAVIKEKDIYIKEKEKIVELLTEQKNHFKASNDVLQKRIESLHSILEELKNEANMSADIQKIRSVLFSPL